MRSKVERTSAFLKKIDFYMTLSLRPIIRRFLWACRPDLLNDGWIVFDNRDQTLTSNSYPSWNGSRVPPVSSTKTDLASVYSLIASIPFSRPMPLRPKPPNGMFGATTR